MRILLADHGPLLFKMITKSIILRISRENKRAPVILDDQFAYTLESLVASLAVEIITHYTTHVSRYRRLNCALAEFIRGLFSIAAPSQVSQLISIYFATLKENITNPRSPLSQDPKIVMAGLEIKLQFLDEMSDFDHFVAANFPLTIDAPLAIFSSQINERLNTGDEYTTSNGTFGPNYGTYGFNINTQSFASAHVSAHSQLALTVGTVYSTYCSYYS